MEEKQVSRRSSLRRAIIGGGIGIATAQSGLAKSMRPTPPDVEGPFHPIQEQKDKDFDLTRVQGREGLAKGEVIEIRGRVLDTSGQSITDATVELWQANAAGRYAHPRDSNKAPLDPNFQGWAIVPSGKDGGFRFKTIKPGPYPAARNWDRPPHIHFKVTKFGFQPITTQMYFPDEELNKVDKLLQRKDQASQKLMIARPSADEKGVLLYNIILADAGEGRAQQAE